ncbi:low-density lipoprotein receptor-related protein 12-like [Saccoglossus kowalevskii]
MAVITSRKATLLLFLLLQMIDKSDATEYLEDNCGESIVSYGGRLESQRYATYRNNFACDVILEAPSVEHQLIILYDYIDLEYFDDTTCVDYIEIRDGDSDLSNLLLRACTTDIIEGYYHESTSDKVMVRIVTDETTTSKGFSLTFTAVKFNNSECTNEGMFECGNDYCISNDLTCDGIDNCANNQDEIVNNQPCPVVGPNTNKPDRHKDNTKVYLEDNCGETIVGYGGRLESQKYATYRNDFQCDVILEAPSIEHQIIILYDYIDLEYFDDTSCVDYIEIYDGDSYYSNLLLRACSNDIIEGHYHESTSDKVMVRMVTDEAVTSKGFSLTYTAVIFNSSECTNQGMFDCGNNYCISNDLTCDGINNCANNQDEIVYNEYCPVVGPDTDKPDRDSDDDYDNAVIIATDAATTVLISLMATALLPNKREATYTTLFRQIFERQQLNPTSIMSDFESAAINAAGTVFPNATRKECFYNLSQCVYRRVQVEGLQQRYQEDNDFG